MKLVRMILAVGVLVVCARLAVAGEPQEILPTGNIAFDSAISIVNAMNRQLKMIEDEANLAIKAADHAKQLAELQQQLQAEKKKLTELDKQLAQQEGDLLANFKSQKAGKSDAEVDALEAEYKRRKKELDAARKQVNGLPKQLTTVASYVDSQAKLLRSVKSMEDWVDPKTGRGRLRAQFQLRRNKITALTDKIAGATAKVKEAIDKGSTLDVKVERAGAFSGTISALGAGTPPFEITVNGKLATKGGTVTIGDDRTLRIQVKLVDDRRKQSRTIKDGKFAKKNVARVDYDFEYGIDDRSTSRWVIEEEEYTDWRVEARTARVPVQKASSSGVFAKVKDDVMTITFSPDTASETLHVSVIGRTKWAMTGRRAGSPTVDAADASGNASIDIQIAPSR